MGPKGGNGLKWGVATAETRLQKERKALSPEPPQADKAVKSGGNAHNKPGVSSNNQLVPDAPHKVSARRGVLAGLTEAEK